MSAIEVDYAIQHLQRTFIFIFKKKNASKTEFAFPITNHVSHRSCDVMTPL